jgi:FG-GAP-like repeat
MSIYGWPRKMRIEERTKWGTRKKRRRAGLSMAHASMRGWRPMLEVLEDRTLLSTSIPLSSQGWTPIGPADIANVGDSGRIAGVAADPVDPKTIYIAAAGGGVWKTTDAGQSWTPLTDNQPTLFMGAIAVAPSDPNVIYAGTGEANNSGDSFYGYGILVSTNAGASWTLEAGPGRARGAFYRKCVSRIAIDPTNPQIVYAAIADAGNNGVGGNDGIWKSVDGGQNWTNTTTSITTNSSFTDVIVDPTNSQTLYAAVGNFFGSGSNGIYKTTDGGTTWTELQGRLPTDSIQQPEVGRIALAISKTNSPQTLYTIMSDSGFYDSLTVHKFGTLFKFMKSTDGGLTWADLTQGTPQVLGGSNVTTTAPGQGWYDIVVSVDPTNADHVFAGGTANGGKPGMIESFDGGNTWINISSVSHTDVHALEFDANGKLLNGNDGGIWRLDNAAPNNLVWANLNSNLQITQFTGIALHPTNPNIAYGGSQDNGTEKFNDNLGWNQVDGGDGGFVRVDGGHPNTVYHTFPFGNNFFQRSDDGGSTWTSKTTGIKLTDSANFYPPYVIDSAESNRLLLGTDKVYETVTGGNPNPDPPWMNNGWVAISPVLNPFGAPIDAVAFAPSSVDTVYAASAGVLYGTVDHGAHWNSLLSLAGLSDIKVDPVNSQVVFVVSSAFDVPRIERTTDGGATWTNLSGNFPNIPVNSVLLDPWTKVLYAGTDAGVYASNDYLSPNPHWAPLKIGMPNAQVVDLELSTVQLQLNTRGYILGAGTHGRGMWELDTTHFTQTNTVPVAGVAAGTQFTITVNALDPFNQPIQGYTGVYTGTAHFSSTDPLASLPQDYSFTTQDNDTHTFTLSLATTGLQTITISDAVDGVDPVSVTIQVNPGATAHFQVSAPAQATAGTSFGVTVTAMDAFGNLTPAYAGTIQFGTSDTQPGVVVPANYTFVPGTDQGIHTFANGFTLDTAGVQTVSAQDAGTPSIQGAARVRVLPAAASQFLVSAPSTAVAGATFSITVSALDPFMNVAPSYRGQVHFTSSDKGAAVVLPSDYIFTATDTGIHSFSNIILNTGGNQTITATDSVTASITGSATVLVTAGAVSHLSIVAPPTVIAGVPFTATVQARDRFENVNPNYLGTINFTTTDTSPFKVLPANYTFVAGDAGSHTFTNGFVMGTAGTQTISVKDTSFSTIKGSVTLTVGNPVPVINGVNPPSVAEQNGGFVLTVFGTGFVPSSVVKWNGSSLATTFVSQGQLQVTVPAANVTDENVAALTVVNPTPGGGASNTQSFNITDANLQASVAPISATEGTAFSGQIARFIDQNPKAPLSDFTTNPGGVTIDWGDNSTSTGQVSQPGGLGTPFVVSGSHTYSEDGPYTINMTVTDLGGSTIQATGGAAIADAALTGNANAISVTRDIPFSGTVATFTDANANASLTDFTTSPGGALINWGDSTSSAGTVTQPGGVGTQFVVSGSHTFTNPGSSTMTVTITDLGGSTIAPTATVRVTKRFDIVGRASQSGQIFVGSSNGSSFAASLWGQWNPGVTWVDVQSGDFNGDGRADLVGRVLQSGQWWVAISNGSSYTTSLWGSWSPAVHWADVKVGDFTGDGKADIVGRVLESGQWWVAQSTGSSFTNNFWATWNPAVTWVDVNVGDFNGDHKADIVGRVMQSGQWWTGLSTGSSFNTSLWAQWNPSFQWADVRVGDFNGDGQSDIAGRAAASGQWWVGLSSGTSFNTTLWTTWNPSITWVDVNVGDFNGDGMTDIVGRDLNSGIWYVAQSSGTAFKTSIWATWSPAVTWVDVQVGDFNGDGKSDITGRVSQSGQWWTGISNGSGFNTGLWATWNPAVTWVDVHADNYTL